MTNQDTADADGTAIQVAQLAHAGSQLVRSRSTPRRPPRPSRDGPQGPRSRRRRPIIGDFHYNGHVLLRSTRDGGRAGQSTGSTRATSAPSAARALQTIVGRPSTRQAGPDQGWAGARSTRPPDRADGRQRPDHEPRNARDVMIDAMIESALRSAELAESTGLRHDRIILSARSPAWASRGCHACSPTQRLPAPPRLTEAGMGIGDHPSTAGLALLLTEGIGDTIRVSRRRKPGAGRELGSKSPTDPPVARAPLVPARSAPVGLRPHHLDVLPGDGPRHPDLPQGPDARLAWTYRRRGPAGGPS
jgi:(E)-4-hydroxy-3-methylbut-2-enyl-diphosphate synthase